MIEGALRGESALVTRDGHPVFMTVPLGKRLETQHARLEFATALFDSEQISLGLAARMAGLSHSDMINELGRRGIATIRLAPGDLEGDPAAFGG